MRLSARIARAATSPDEAVQLVEEIGSGIRTYARELLGIADLDERVRELMPGTGRPVSRGGRPESSRSRMSRRSEAGRDPLSLREQGAELLRESADVSYEQGVHPAYARILSELAPDEGRILRLLALQGPQPAVDIHAANLIGIGSQLVEQGVNMLGAEAGLRYVERVPAYLNNIHRLGLIALAREPIEDPIRYQVLEAQPDAIAAIKRAGRAKSVHRSINLTPFGKDFCDVCLPLDPAEIETLAP
jgi:hypothetical protein